MKGALPKALGGRKKKGAYVNVDITSQSHAVGASSVSQCGCSVLKKANG